jgi:predicted transcriptional regulator
MDYSTVQTYLRRLETKGYLSTKRDGRNKLYSPKVQATQVICSLVTDLVDRLFDGQVLPMMNHLVANHQLSPEELDELRRFIDQQEDSRDAS